MGRQVSPDTIQSGLNEAADEGLRFLAKAFRGGVDLSEQTNRSLLTAATSTVSSWSRHEATQSAREQTRLGLALALSRDADGAFASALKVAMPTHSALKRLSDGRPE